MTRFTLLLALACVTTFTQAQKIDAAKAEALLKSYPDSARINRPEQNIKVLNLIDDFYSVERDSCRLAQIKSFKVNYFDKIGQLDSAVSAGNEALSLFRPSCDSLTLISININLSRIYLSLNELDKTIEIVDRSLAMWNPNWPPSAMMGSLYTNKAIAYIYKGDFEAGVSTFRELLQNSIAEGNEVAALDAHGNLGAAFGMLAMNGLGDHYHDSTIVHVRASLQIAKQREDTESIGNQYYNLSIAERERNNFNAALAYCDSAHAAASDANLLELKIMIAQTRSGLYVAKNNPTSALAEFQLYSVLKDSLLNIEKVKAISEMQEKYESEKKQRQINELEVTNLNSALEQARLAKMRNIYMFVGLGILLIAGVLYGRLQLTRKAKNSIQKEKDISENLLLNILPYETAKELKEKGSADAKLINEVTVLFTDFKGFTAMSELLSPKDLVSDLHACFSAFDRICEKFKIEKIKTIGDAYMAAGGLPVPNITHAEDVVQAALEMAKVVEASKAEKISQGLPYFEIRIGIHTGPVVAGIVGVKKFQYDIWGDTVNTASRMESSGEVGKVNISETTFECIKSTFNCIYRGKVAAKGKGEIDMYFVEGVV
jgi:class 3 adenylate cyclase